MGKGALLKTGVSQTLRESVGDFRCSTAQPKLANITGSAASIAGSSKLPISIDASDEYMLP
jgi:hypothetical protein